MSPEPASILTTGASQAINAARNAQRLAQFADLDLLIAVEAQADHASRAGKEIIDKAEWILTEAKICRWEDDDAVQALVREIEHYLGDHPRLESMSDALGALAPLLRALQERAEKLRPELRPGRKRGDRVDAVGKAETALQELLAFVEWLRGETQSLPAETGIASIPMGTLRDIAWQPAPARVAAAQTIVAAVAAGKREVADSRTRRISGVFAEALASVRAAFK